VELAGFNSIAIVSDADSTPTLIVLNLNRTRTRIQRVFYQLLEQMSGSLNHFAGSDLIDNIRGKKADFRRK
jgi:hypothetical protein